MASSTNQLLQFSCAVNQKWASFQQGNFSCLDLTVPNKHVASTFLVFENKIPIYKNFHVKNQNLTNYQKYCFVSLSQFLWACTIVWYTRIHSTLKVNLSKKDLILSWTFCPGLEILFKIRGLVYFLMVKKWTKPQFSF